MASREFDLGMHHFLNEEWKLAMGEFQQALRTAPKEARSWSYLGICLAHIGRASDAELALSRAIALSPQDGEAWFHLGVARSLRNEWTPAVSAFRRSVALNPNDLVAWHRLGVALAESGERAASTAAFERALVLSRETGANLPESPVPAPEVAPDPHLAEVGAREDSREAQSWLSLALSLLSLGDEEEAMAAYERAYTIDPERARRSLFRPMLQLMTANAGAPTEEAAPAAAPAPPTPPPAPRTAYTPRPRNRDRRPEVG